MKLSSDLKKSLAAYTADLKGDISITLQKGSHKKRDDLVTFLSDVCSVSSKLNLPWRPVLAASGVTSHYLSKDTMLIEKYLESWKSKPWHVVKRLFVPTKADEEEKL